MKLACTFKIANVKVESQKTWFLGTYDVSLIAPYADDVIFSVTWSEGFLDDYVSFELPVVLDPLSDEEFDAIAEKPELEFDNAFPVTDGLPEVPPTTSTFKLTTEIPDANENYTASDLTNRYEKFECV